ncbi:MAG: hypothetical protein ACI9BK_002850, partial [Acidimicrobiales bacterium]
MGKGFVRQLRAGCNTAAARQLGSINMSVLDSDAIFAADPEAIRCPYPIFDKLRTESPVYWSEAGECFMITRYDDIVHIS